MGIGERAAAAVRRRVLRARLAGQDFTIVSNNCWGAHVYQQLGRPYQTPFVGLFLAPACYLALVPRLRWYLARPLRFVPRSRHECVNAFRDGRPHRYPIGLLGDDVELQFLHYGTEAEAAATWVRRAARVTPDDARLFFKFCDRDGCTPEQLAAFDAAPVAHKVCFVSRPAPGLGCAVHVPGAAGGQVPDGLQLSRVSPAYFDAAGWVAGTGTRPGWWPFRCV